MDFDCSTEMLRWITIVAQNCWDEFRFVVSNVKKKPGEEEIGGTRNKGSCLVGLLDPLERACFIYEESEFQFLSFKCFSFCFLTKESMFNLNIQYCFNKIFYLISK
jgi:hypothetical protein